MELNYKPVKVFAVIQLACLEASVRKTFVCVVIMFLRQNKNMRNFLVYFTGITIVKPKQTHSPLIWTNQNFTWYLHCHLAPDYIVAELLLCNIFIS